MIRRATSLLKKPIEKEETVRFVALGGLEEIGRNMMFFEYKDEIIIIDAGLQFPEEATPGIDFIIPNIAYLEGKKKNIKALIITHGHYDHIGAIPYVIEKLGNPTIFTTSISKEIIIKRQEDFPNLPKLNFEIVKSGESRQLSKNFRAKFFGVTHNIPEGVGMILDTAVGKIVHAGEFKFDYDVDGKPRGMDVWKEIGAQKIHTLLIESTGAETPGYSISERVVEQEIEKLLKKADGRIIVGTFSSLLDRLAEIIKIAERLDKKVAISGLSMKTNIQIAQNLGFMKIKKGTVISLEEINRYRDDKLLILCTGAQGEPNASLMKIANGEHRHIQIKKGDTVILSSSVVPGNERSVQIVKDNIARQGALIYDYKMLDIHSSGHAPQEELKIVMKFISPKFLIPMHGYYFMRWRNAQHAQEALKLTSQQTILVDNGQVVSITKNSVKITEETVPAYYVMVDGLGVGDVGEVVMRDRLVLSQEGMVVIIITLDRRTGRFLKNPDIISRGFIYLREHKEFVEELRRKVRNLIDRIPRHQQFDSDYIKSLMRDQVGLFLYGKIKRRPMILPVVIEV
ncbi:ribonuclease J [Candidatus Wolfebacteria bacterium CG03_land_8_20_14_0_80_40_12]|uniref:Ribonuclease J n=1 Tax=Candidatus Wolfebacteria bacterium CG03_land_8_20_14_0_80_40_12 TaxID=1975069 RepID=A0A2M7B5S2_9BACT|nr:MAG: ribonuclease J [Candidatus Wolfebacteria bacterium CG03_land_8_20_14_0_80_40_12]